MKKSLFLIFFLVLSCKSQVKEISVQVIPEKPTVDDTIKLKFSRKFTGYIWIAELSEGALRRTIPNVKFLKNKKEYVFKADKKTSFLLFTLEEKDSFLRDTTFHILFYEKDGKPRPFAYSFLSAFEEYEENRKIELWEKEREYYPEHYDFLFSKYSNKFYKGEISKEDVVKEIKEILKKEKDNPSFLFSAIGAAFMLNDSSFKEELLNILNEKGDFNYKYASRVYQNIFTKNIARKELNEYIKQIKMDGVDFFIPQFRSFVLTRFSRFAEFDTMINYIKEREKEGFVLLEEILFLIRWYNYLSKKEYKEIDELALKLEKMIKDDEYLRKSYLFMYSYPYAYHEYIKGKRAETYDILSDYFYKKGNTEKALHYINMIKKEDIEGYIYFNENFYYKKAEMLKKAKKIQESLKIYGYLYFIYDKEDARDSIKILCKDNFETKLKKIEEIVKKEFKVAPNFEGITISDERLKLSEYKGKVIVLNFWSINCNPCVKEIPELNKIVEVFKNDNDVIFIAVTYDKKENIENFLKAREFDYKIVITDSEIFKKYGVFSIPAHMIIDRKGCIVFRQIGYTEDLKNKIINKINKLNMKM